MTVCDPSSPAVFLGLDLSPVVNVVQDAHGVTQALIETVETMSTCPACGRAQLGAGSVGSVVIAWTTS